MRPSRPLFELIACGVSDFDLNRVIAAIDRPPLGRDFVALLNSIPISMQLKAALWDLAYVPHHKVEPVSEKAALEICREVLREFQAFNELGTKERTGSVQDFLMDVKAQIRAAITTAFDKFADEVLNTLETSTAMRDERIKCGRYFAASGIWPVNPHTFERPRNR